MRVVIVGMGVQGKKRVAAAGTDVVATVDPVINTASHSSIRQIPLGAYDAALICTPDAQKLEILEYLLSQRKHVMVEKPLLASGEVPLDHLDRLASQNEAACYTAYNHRFEPNIVELKQVIESKEIGTVYQARFYYGNGTAADVRQSPWRDQGLGVVVDLGSHLLDLVDFIFDERPSHWTLWAANRFENRAVDQAVFGSQGPIFIHCETTLLSWRNSFSIDIYGETGSVHLSGLCKWGPSELTIHKRVFPSGRPTEQTVRIEQPDPTWAAEYSAFQKHCVDRRRSIEKDIWIDGVFRQLALQYRNQRCAA